jgi:hypothetical protein
LESSCLGLLHVFWDYRHVPLCPDELDLESLKIAGKSQLWGYRPVITALRRLRQKDCEFETSLGKRWS